ncbi:SGNH/GDSL hydrolase family protein [Winogradskya humida]|uniref:SGNH hydrolase-type esterase domain-containing protein n=1 Tax=Winogradskya humida TaxID=113566 RepID=A0ABQ4A279_9ACTN|nr:SGNH/GDSL hydrolase family protein [Actinoplanes humidus]GIE24960.1 hypothetical protein Ahu01nite_080620 [Actinoplanes humidus]
MVLGTYGRRALAALMGFCLGGGGAAYAAPGGPGVGDPDTPFGTVRVMPLGDSIVRGTGAPGFDSFRTVLRDHLIRDGMQVDFVGSQSDGTGADRDHEGHGGYDLGELAFDVDGWLHAYQPDVILLEAGTNNVTQGDDPGVMVGDLGTLIDRIRAVRPEAHVFLAAIAISRVPAEAETGRIYNALLPGFVAQRQDPRLTLVDQSSVAGIDLHDTHHPNAFGYEKMAWNWYRSMAGVFALPGLSGPDPYQKTETYRCIIEHGTSTRCRTWVLRDQPEGSREWQTLIKRKVSIDGVSQTVEFWAGAAELLGV